jgi:hypothetical protein
MYFNLKVLGRLVTIICKVNFVAKFYGCLRGKILWRSPCSYPFKATVVIVCINCFQHSQIYPLLAENSFNSQIFDRLCSQSFPIILFATIPSPSDPRKSSSTSSSVINLCRPFLPLVEKCLSHHFISILTMFPKHSKFL